MRRFKRLLVVATVSLLIVPQQSHAATTYTMKPPFAWAGVQRSCGTPAEWGRSIAGNAVCGSTASASRTGRMRLNQSLLSPQNGVAPGTGVSSGLAMTLIPTYVGRTRQVKVSVTMRVKSAKALHVDPKTGLLTGAGSMALLFSYVGYTEWNYRTGRSTSLVAAGYKIIAESQAPTSTTNRDVTVTVTLKKNSGYLNGGLLVVLPSLIGAQTLGIPIQEVVRSAYRVVAYRSGVYVGAVEESLPHGIAAVGDTGKETLSVDGTVTKVVITY